MNFFKALFGSKVETKQEKKEEDNAKNFEVLKYDGVRALQSGQITYAMQCFSHALKLQEDLEIRDYYSQALIRNGDMLHAYGQLQKLAEAQPDNQQIFIRMADVAYMMEDYGSMADSCEKALLIDKDNPLVMYLYARACIGQGDSSNAIAMLTKAISLKADYGDAYLLRGETYLGLGDLDSADADAEYLLKHAQDSEETYMLKARIEEKRANYEQSIDFYSKVIELNPFSAVAFKERSAAKRVAGDEQGAEEDIKAAEEVEAEHTSYVGTEGKENNDSNIEEKMNRAYKNNNPYGF